MRELNSQRVLDRLSKIIQDGQQVLTTLEPRYRSTEKTKRSKPDGIYVDELLHLKFTISALHFIESVMGKESIYYKNFDLCSSGIAEKPVKKQITILKALHETLSDTWCWSAQGLANAGVFSNMLEESEHLLEKGFKLPSAVLVGCVLESHLKSLCQKNSIEIFQIKENDKKVLKKASTLNQELTVRSVYNKTESKEVSSYLGIRNSAAHGRDDEFSAEQVKLLILGVSSFITRSPT